MRKATCVLLIASTAIGADLGLERSYRQAIRQLEPLGPSTALSDVLNGLGTLYFDRGEYARAEHWGREALRVELESGATRPVEVARRTGNIGSALAAQGHAREAIPYVERALRILEFHGACSEMAHAWNTLGTIALQRRRAGEAIPRFERAIELWSGRAAERAQGLANLATAYAALGDDVRSLALWREAAGLAAQHSLDSRGHAAILLGYASALERAGWKQQGAAIRSTGQALLRQATLGAGATVDRSDLR